jgi:uncharacterized ferritin-like protein (DUF455 family)
MSNASSSSPVHPAALSAQGNPARTIGFSDIGGLRLREAPARDACFTIVYRDADMHEYGDMSDRSRREMLHRHMTNEITSLDIAADCVAQFPDAPWDLRMELARQCWDESRHVQALNQRLRQLGGHKGEFPISTLEWSVTCAVDDLPGRLAIQNRTLEAGAIDIVGGLMRSFRAAGDPHTAALLETINADEVQHVRFANRWIREMAHEQPRILLQVASAVRFLVHANALFQIRAGEVSAAGHPLGAPEERIPAVNVDDRRLAGFTEDEIHEILRQAGFRALVPDASAGEGMASAPAGAGADPAPGKSLPAQPPVESARPQVRPRAEPASVRVPTRQTRDARFDVRRVWRDMENLPRDHPEVSQEFLHRQMNEEVESLEIAARNIVDFPQADWQLRMQVARQCADEARHAVAFRRLFEQRGGRVGQYPVLNFQFDLVTAIPTLIGRLAVANRSFEASGIDAIQDGIKSSRRKGDAAFVNLFDAQLADEVLHVRFANEWIRQLIARDGPRAIMALARAITQADNAFRRIVQDDTVVYPVDAEIRREAGFTDEEIASAQAMGATP